MTHINLSQSDFGDLSIDSSNGLHPLQISQTNSSPAKVHSQSRTLRRKRSSANASLTSRPSLLSLQRDHRISISKAQMSPTLNGRVSHTGSLNLSPSSPFTLTSTMKGEDSMEMELQKTMTTLTLDHDQSNIPYFGSSGLADLRSESFSSSSVTESDISITLSEISSTSSCSSRRPSWETEGEEDQTNGSMYEGMERNRLILAHVITIYDQNDNIINETLGHALITPNLLISKDGQIKQVEDLNEWIKLRSTVEQSRIVAMCDGEARRTFKIDVGSCSKGKRSISTFYLQADMNASEIGQPNLNNAKLLKLTIHGLDEKEENIDGSRWNVLPDQLRSLLLQTRGIEENLNKSDHKATHSKIANADGRILAKILNLLSEKDVREENIL